MGRVPNSVLGNRWAGFHFLEVFLGRETGSGHGSDDDDREQHYRGRDVVPQSRVLNSRHLCRYRCRSAWLRR